MNENNYKKDKCALFYIDNMTRNLIYVLSFYVVLFKRSRVYYRALYKYCILLLLLLLLFLVVTHFLESSTSTLYIHTYWCYVSGRFIPILVRCPRHKVDLCWLL